MVREDAEDKKEHTDKNQIQQTIQEFTSKIPHKTCFLHFKNETITKTQEGEREKNKFVSVISIKGPYQNSAEL